MEQRSCSASRVHFFVLGAGIFLVSALVGDSDDPPRDEENPCVGGSIPLPGTTNKDLSDLRLCESSDLGAIWGRIRRVAQATRWYRLSPKAKGGVR